MERCDGCKGFFTKKEIKNPKHKQMTKICERERERERERENIPLHCKKPGVIVHCKEDEWEKTLCLICRVANVQVTNMRKKAQAGFKCCTFVTECH